MNVAQTTRACSSSSTIKREGKAWLREFRYLEHGRLANTKGTWKLLPRARRANKSSWPRKWRWWERKTRGKESGKMAEWPGTFKWKQLAPFFAPGGIRIPGTRRGYSRRKLDRPTHTHSERGERGQETSTGHASWCKVDLKTRKGEEEWKGGECTLY